MAEPGDGYTGFVGNGAGNCPFAPGDYTLKVTAQGFRVAIVNCWDRAAGNAARDTLRDDAVCRHSLVACRAFQTPSEAGFANINSEGIN